MKTINARSLFKLDWLILAIIALLCFIAFQQGDMYHTVGSSFAYLKGHFFDFYDYNKQHIGGNNYLPSSYILFAIWNIPLKILGLVNLPTTEISLVIIWWNKLLTTLFYVFSGILVYKIGKSVGFSETNSKLTAFIWLTTPIALFSQFIFGQYDVFTLFFTLLGLYYYLEKNNIKFIIFFGVAMTFKYFPMFIFMPLLLAREKDVWKIIKDSCLVVLPVAIEILIYYPSAAFQTGVLGFGAPKFILQTQLGGQYASIQLVVLLWMLLCAYAYFNQIEDRNNFIKYIFFYCGIACFLLYGMSMWNPQWVLFATPFLVFGAVINKKPNIFLFLDILLMFFFVGFTVNYWENHVDQKLFTHGVFQYAAANIHLTDGFLMKDVFRINDKNTFYTMFSAIFLIKAVFSHPKYCMDDMNIEIDKHLSTIRLRFIIGISIFVVPAFVCLASHILKN